jgi:hypothetical protein
MLIMPDKRKFSDRAARQRFIAVWAWGNIAAWLGAVGAGLLIGLTPLAPLLQGNFFVLSLLIGVIPAVCLAWVQKRIVQHYLHQTMHHWIRVSLAGGLASGLLLYAYVSATSFISINPALSFIPIVVPLAAVQWYWLRTQVKRAWLWLAAGMLNALLFAMPALLHILTNGGNIFALLVLLMQTIFSGVIMHALWADPDDKQKHAVDDEADAAMIERLSETTGNDSAKDDEAAQKKQKRYLDWLGALLRGYPRYRRKIA